MDDVVFSATTRNGKYTFKVEDGGEKYTKDRFSIETNFGVDYADTPNQILGQLVMESEWKEGTFEKILVDELGIGKEYLQIVKMIRAKYNWLEKLPKGSEGRIFYFEIGRYFRNGLYKNVPSDKIFKMIDDYIATSNFKEDVKSEKKTLKESVRCVHFEQIVDSRFDFDLSSKNDGEKILLDRKEKILKLCDSDFTVHTSNIRFIKFDDGTCQYRQNYLIRKDNHKLTWNDLYKIINSVKAVHYDFKKVDDSMFENRNSNKTSLKESSKSESIVAKLSKEFLGYNVGIVSEADGVEDSITVGFDENSKMIYNYVVKELRGYKDTSVTYDSVYDMCFIDFYKVSSYSDRELIQTIEDIVWNVNAKFDIKEV